MGKYLAFLFLILANTILFSQNVGVGTNSPQYKLDVAGRVRLQHTAGSTSGLWLDGLTLPTRSFIGTFSDDYVGIYGNGGIGWNFVMNVANGNIGIGTTAPAFKMDLKGRMRIQQDGSSSAGIWLDGTTLPTRSFIGTLNEDYVGFYGSGGAGWNFVMNVNNGNVGIGTTTPTTKLDVNGSFRLRSNTVLKGAVLTSIDANGNAQWGNPVAFKAEGCLNATSFTVQDLTWTKMMFNQSTAFNLGGHYLPLQSDFVVPESGIYHFDCSITNDERYEKSSIRIRLNRNGSISTIGEIYNQGGLDYYNNEVYFSQPSNVSVEAQLLANDVVWVEIFYDLAPVSGSNTTIANVSSKVYFEGNLIARN